MPTEYILSPSLPFYYFRLNTFHLLSQIQPEYIRLYPQLPIS